MAIRPVQMRLWSVLQRGWVSMTPPSAMAQPTVEMSPDLMVGADAAHYGPGAARDGTTNAQAGKEEMRPAWVEDMPTRMIACKLLDRDRLMAGHKELYDEVNATGMLKSRRHFKHCLKLMRISQRIQVICQGPARVGSSRRIFAVKLTKRGQVIYSWHRNHPRYKDQSTESEAQTEGSGLSRGLADVL